MCVHIYTHMRARLYMYVCMHVCMYECVGVWVCVRPLFHLIFAPICSLFPVRFMLNLGDLGSNYLPSIHFVPKLRLSSFQEKLSDFDGKEDFKRKFKED